MEKQTDITNTTKPSWAKNGLFINVIAFTIVTLVWQGVDAFQKTKPWDFSVFLAHFFRYLIVPFIGGAIAFAVCYFIASLWRQIKN